VSKKHVEVPVPREVIDSAKVEIEPYLDKIGSRATGFNGSDNQKIIGWIGEKITGQYLGFTADEYTGFNLNGTADRGDFIRDGQTFDVKASFCPEYKEKGTVPDYWGVLIPESQWQLRQHDYYIRCAVDSDDPEHITKLCFVGVCVKKAAAEFSEVEHLKCWQPIEQTVLMRIVPERYTFDIDLLKKDLEQKQKEATEHGQQHIHPDGDERRVGQYPDGPE